MSYETSRELAAHGLQGVYSPDAELAAIAAAVDAAGVAPKTHRYVWQLTGDMQLRQQVIDKLLLQQARDAAAFAATDEYEFHGSATPADWIRHTTKVSGTAASSSICVGEQMASLPASVAAMRTGEIGFAHVSLMASTAAAVTESKDAPPFDEQLLLDKAREHSVGRFSHDCRHVRHAADAAGFLSEHLTEVEWRSFELSSCDGGVLLRGRLDAVGAAVLRSALEPLAKKDGASDTRRRTRRMADALIELSNHALDSGQLPSQAGQRPHVQVTTTLETLMGVCGAPAGEMQFAGPISLATVQRFACDSGVTRILLDSKSRSSMWAGRSALRRRRCGERWWRATAAVSGPGVIGRRHGRRRTTSNTGAGWASPSYPTWVRSATGTTGSATKVGGSWRGPTTVACSQFRLCRAGPRRVARVRPLMSRM